MVYCTTKWYIETTKFSKQKHPRSADVSEYVFLPNEAETFYFIKRKSYNAKLVRKATLKTRGGSSGMDADGWRRIKQY